MLENLSQPVAFATAPLDVAAATNEKSAVDDEGADSDASSNDSFCIIDSDSHDSPKTPKHISSAGSPAGTIKKLKSKSLPDPALARSVYPPPPRVQQLEVENAALKAELEKTVMRATLAERTLRQRAGQELALRESILSVRREAQRAMSATTAALRSPGFAGQPPSRTQTLIATPSITSPSTILTPTPTPIPAVKLPVVPSPRIAELEEEIRVLKAENEKQKAQMAKYRERWEKLKESAKRKRAAKDVKDSQNTTIPEEQEPDADADAGGDTKSDLLGRRYSGGGEDGVDTPPPGRTVSGLSSHGVLRSPDIVVSGLSLH
ncbi:hypothetical protein BDV93DRAFT_23771 [Ceratobasidium sp. AG-I]|nr:hypothetical protein BDV93DRAFT_23771 [Ceratobasidium sp. AG-I]